MNEVDALDATIKWVKTVVIGLGLCPFAKKEFDQDRIRFTASNAETNEELLSELQNEFKLLDEQNNIETTLLVIENLHTSFHEYNQFLDLVDDFIKSLNYEGVYQVASFHPNYRFEGSQEEDVENYTNRSPFPIFHIIREKSLEVAIAGHPNIHEVPEKNKRTMRKLGVEKLRSVLADCLGK